MTCNSVDSKKLDIENAPSIMHKIGCMLGRVFTPYKMPVEGICFIDVDRACGHKHFHQGAHIGADRMYRYSSFLKDSSQKPIISKDEDFYVPIGIWKKDPSAENGLILRIAEYILRKLFFFLGSVDENKEGFYYVMNPDSQMLLRELPSALFNHAKENDIITFYMGERKVSLALKQMQQNELNGIRYANIKPRCYRPETELLTFEQAFSRLEKDSRQTRRGWVGAESYYAYLQDISKDSNQLIDFYTSPSAKIFYYQEHTFRSPLDGDISFFKNCIENKNSIDVDKIVSDGDNIIFSFNNLKKDQPVRCFIDKGVLILAFKEGRQLSEIELKTRKTLSEWCIFRYNLNLENELDLTSIEIDHKENDVLTCKAKFVNTL